MAATFAVPWQLAHGSRLSCAIPLAATLVGLQGAASFPMSRNGCCGLVSLVVSTRLEDQDTNAVFA